MAGRAIFYHSFTRPVGNALSMCPANPITFLSEMALTTQFVAVIHTHLGTFFGDQNITIIFIMAGETGQQIVFIPMVEEDVTMGCLSRSGSGDNLVVVTLAAPESFNFVLTGFGPKKSTLVFYPGNNGFFRNRRDRFNRTVVKRCPGIFDCLDDAAFLRVGIPSGQNDNHRQYTPQDIFIWYW